MESTWTTRELPVLEATVALLEQIPERIVTVLGISQRSGIHRWDVYASLQAMDGEYVELVKKTTDRDPSPHQVARVFPEARRLVGQWPSAESLAEQVLRALAEAAQSEPDTQKRSRLTDLTAELREMGMGVLTDVLAKFAAHTVGLG